MSHTDDWSDAFEVLPTDDNYGYEIDNYIRQLKISTRERLEIDHEMKVSTTHDGKHKKITFRKQSSDPTTGTEEGFLFTKDVDDKIELFWKDEDGNVIQLTSGGALIVTETSANATMKMKVIEIGTWDMDAESMQLVAHGLTLANIRSVDVMIRQDSVYTLRPIYYGLDPDSAYFYVDATYVHMERAGGSYFDNANFSAAINRGWITIWYEE